MEYEFYLDLFFLWVFFLDLLALYLASCLGRMPMRVPGFLAAAAAGSVCNCVLAVFPVLPAAAELFLATARHRKPHVLDGFFSRDAWRALKG